MPFATITPPPGVVKPGTVYDAKGRWYDTLWVRWFEGVMQAIGGYGAVESAGAQITAGQRVSGTWSWKDNEDRAHLAFGGPSAIKILRTGTVYDVTPSSGFTAGNADAVMATGNYGVGDYGEGLYGVGDELLATLTEAQSYSMDNYGEDFVFVAQSDGKLYYVDSDGTGGNPGAATQLSNSPTGLVGVVVTPENFIMALGAGGNPRYIRWGDQDDKTVWTASSTNQAGDLNLPGKGAIMGARRSQAETLVWTDNDLFSIRFIGGTFIYQAIPVGAVGAVSRRSMGVVGSVAYWMSRRGFYIYNGFTQAIDCPLGDAVFSDLNENQLSKIWCETRQEFGEVTWHYPSAETTECDKSVTYNFEEGFWYNNVVDRTAGEDRGAMPYPVAFAPTGTLWQHEIGSSYGAGVTPTAISGPLEIGQGDRIMDIQSLIPDEKTLGDVDIYLLSAFYPTEAGTSAEISNGPFTPGNPTDMRVTGRQVRLKIAQDQPGWRIGSIRADVEAGGER